MIRQLTNDELGQLEKIALDERERDHVTVDLDDFASLINEVVYRRSRDNKNGSLTVESLVSMRNKHAYVRIAIGDVSVQMSAAEATQHALGIIEAVAASKMDAFLNDFVTKVSGEEAARLMLAEFRRSRT